MRDIMVHTGRYDAWGSGAEYAADLAARVDGALTGVFVHPSPLYMMPPYASGDVIQAIFETARSVEQSADAARGAFIAWATKIGVRQAFWQVAEGRAPETLAHIGNWHDLLVLERNPDAPWGAPPDLGAVVLASRMPCVVVPPHCREASLGCIAVAWNGSAEAVRALHCALPLLHHAAAVILLDGAHRAPEIEAGWLPPFDVQTYLSRHDIRATVKPMLSPDDRAGEAILAAAGEVGANLLVMGAYGRSRFSEWAFGGVTRTVLHEATLPVLMRN
ncbi:universal stress protein [Dokdonella sp.]|uniref:universal stress protein n=1 Tax=Dokdonella sp. TaxID=2291710 RepID=UPI002F427E28